MKRNVLKIVTILMLVAIVLFALTAPTFASEFNPHTTPFTVTDGSQASASAGRIIGAIINIVQIVGIGVAIIMLIVLAIKYISAAPNDKAEIKKHAVVYVVGAIILFAASGILQIVKNFAGNIHS